MADDKEVLIFDGHDEKGFMYSVSGKGVTTHKKRKNNLAKYLAVLLIAATLVLGVYVWYSGRSLDHTISNHDSFEILNTVYVNIPGAEGSNWGQQNNLISSLSCDITGDDNRIDCYPAGIVTEQECARRGCCYKSTNKPSKVTVTNEYKNVTYGRNIDVPWCFFPKNYAGYTVNQQEKSTPLGFTASLSRSSSSGWPNDIKTLQLDVMVETKTRLHFKIFDPNQKRYEVPIKAPEVKNKAQETDYEIKLQKNPFGLVVSRKSTGAVLFNSALEAAPLIFADQFIQITTNTGTGLVYGLGEHQIPFRHGTTWKQLAYWARDAGPRYQNNDNLYGTHPFYVGLEADGKAYGVFLKNSNAMDIDFQPMPALTFRTIGGILDFYIFTGPTVDNVIEQYTDVVGKPFMPPYWSFGFHLCKYGYGSAKELQAVIDRNRAIKIPYEVQWNDIDYMDSYLDWTYDKNSYKELPDIVKDLHDKNQKYMIIIDPGISNTQKPGEYFPFDEGLKRDIFVKNATGQVLIGGVWPGPTAFPDFFHPDAAEWWYQCAKRYHDQVAYDGLWIDMNEPSNFMYGSVDGCPGNNLDDPPYTPGVSGSGKLADRTVCPSAQHSISSHFNLHNMYGYSEAVVTYSALTKLLNKRSIVISRSSYSGLGAHSGHWSGDIISTWESMYYTIPRMLNFQLFGIPMFGADVCGFTQNTTEQLCTRWMQLGSFYPFMRSHSDLNTADQDPAVWSKEAQDSMRNVLETRYKLLPYLYTLFFHSHVNGTPVARSLMSQYPTDTKTFDIDRQFLWGDGLMISPVLEKDAVTVNAYFPNDRWYNLYTGAEIQNTGGMVKLDAPLNTINVHVRGGSIIPTQESALTTVDARKNPFRLNVTLDDKNEACGELFLDDGDTLNTIEEKKYSFVEFVLENQTLKSTVIMAAYSPPSGLILGAIEIMGVQSQPDQITLNGKSVSFSYQSDLKVLSVTTGNVDLLKAFVMAWK